MTATSTAPRRRSSAPLAAANQRNPLGIAQTIVELDDQLLEAGWQEGERALVRRAYNLSVELAPSRYQPNGRHSLCHQVGVAGIVFRLGYGPDLVAAGMLHNALATADWGDGRGHGASPRRRRELARRVSPAVATVVFEVWRARARNTSLPSWLGDQGVVAETDRHLVPIELADMLDKLVDDVMLYLDPQRCDVTLASERGEDLVALARSSSHPAAALALRAGLKRARSGSAPTVLVTSGLYSADIIPLSARPKPQLGRGLWLHRLRNRGPLRRLAKVRRRAGRALAKAGQALGGSPHPDQGLLLQRRPSRAAVSCRWDLEELIVATNVVALFNQLLDAGWALERIELVKRAHDLSVQVLAGRHLTSARPASCHLVGVASILAWVGSDPTVVSSALLQDTLRSGDWGPGPAADRAGQLARIGKEVSPDVADLVATLEHRLARDTILSMGTGPVETNAATIQLAVITEQLGDGGRTWLDGDPALVPRLRPAGDLVELSRALGSPGLSRLLEHRLQVGGLTHDDLVPAATSWGPRLLPRSYEAGARAHAGER